MNNQKNSIPALEKEVKALDKQMTREDAFKKIHQQRDEFNKQNDSEAFAVKYDKEVYQPAIVACHKQSAECYEVPIQQKRDFDINEQRRQTFLQSQKLSRKLQDDWITLEKGQYPLTMKVSEINSKKVAILMKIDDINQANERWKKDTEQLRRNGVIK